MGALPPNFAAQNTSSELREFLENFRPNGYVTFVGIVPDGSTVAETFNGADPSQAAQWIAAQNGSRNLYFTCNPTPASTRRKPTKDDIIEIAAVWADIDPLDDPKLGKGARPWAEERERLEALAGELHALETPPSFIIDSGNGIQPVWLLADPIEASKEYRGAAESLCKQIEAALGAKGTHNIDRLLRVPGTRNFANKRKRDLGRGETQARLLRWTWRRYSWTDLERLAEHLRCTPPHHAEPCGPPRKRVPLGEITLPDDAPEPLEPGRLAELKAEHPDAFDLGRYDGDQSRQDLALANLARQLGWSQHDAWRLIIAVRGDMKAARRDYIERTLELAYAEQSADAPKGGAWPDPAPLPEGLPPVDPFPLELLPDAFVPWVADASERMQVPADYAAVAVMVAAGSAIGRQVGIHPKRHDDWLVVPNLWGALIGRPGLLKSPSLEEALRPIKHMECEAKAKYEAEMKLWEIREEIEKQAKSLRASKIREQIKGHRNFDSLAREIAEEQTEAPVPVRRRFITNDATVEKLGELLSDNPNGVLVCRDELMGWLNLMEREGRDGERAFYLEAWNGTGRFTYDRIGRGTVDIEAACVSVLGGIQPGPLLSYLEGKSWNGAGDDGLLQRFQLAVWPDASAKWVNVDRQPDLTARERAADVFRRLVSIAEAPAEIRALRFDEEAQDAFDAWRHRLEGRVRGNELHPAFEAHLSKYRSLLPSLALICHLADGGGHRVDLRAFYRAEAWCEYLESHAARIYDALIKADLTATRALGNRIAHGDLPSPFRLRDVYRRCWAGLTSKEAAQAAVDILCDLGWLRSQDVKRGGRPSPLYHINPAVRRTT